MEIAVVGGGEERYNRVSRIVGRKARTVSQHYLDADEVAALAGVPEVTVAALEDEAGQSTLPLLRSIRQRSHQARILLCIGSSPREMRSALSAVLEGIATEVVINGQDDLSVIIMRHLLAAEEVSLANVILQVTQAMVSAFAQHALEWAAYRIDANLSVAQWAGGLGLDRKTLSVRFKRSGLHSPHVVLGWHRALYCAYHMRDSSTPVSTIAKTLKVNSASDVNRLVHRYLGAKPSELRDPSGLAKALDGYASLMTPRTDSLGTSSLQDSAMSRSGETGLGHTLG